MRFWELMAAQESALEDARKRLQLVRRQLGEQANRASAAEKELRDTALERDRIRVEQRALSDAYLRLRGLIPGAFDTPYAPTPEQVWETTENALRAALKRSAA